MTLPAPPPIGILVPEFPTQTHAFFWREVRAIEADGTPVAVLSTKRPAADACRHPFAPAARARTTYFFPPTAGSVGWLLARPARAAAAARYVLGLGESGWKTRLRYLGLIPCAAGLVRHARRHGYRHVHVHSCADAAHLVALARILGGPTYSLTLHGDLPVYGVDHKSKMARAAFVFCDARPHADQVVARVGLPPDRVSAVHMGVEVDTYPADPPRDAAPGRLHVVTVARLNMMKGHRYALEAVRAAADAGADIRYSIAGRGEYQGAVEADIARLGLADRVALLGTLGEDEVKALLARADAFVLPSIGLGEAAPVAVMEAMAAGLPVVSSIIGGTPDMIADGEDGFLVAQKDVPGLTAALLRLANDPGLRTRVGRAARERAARQFDSRLLARRLLDVVAATAGGPA